MNCSSIPCFLLRLLLAAACLCGCASGDDYSEYERVRAGFIDKVGGHLSQLQWWRTAVTLRVQTAGTDSVKMWLMSAPDEGTLYDYKACAGGESVSLTMPQGMQQTFYLVSVCRQVKTVTEVVLTGTTEEHLTLPLPAAVPSVERPAAVGTHAPLASDDNAAAALYGSSVRGDAIYNEFDAHQLPLCCDIMSIISLNGTDAKHHHFNCNYELRSNGPFRITWVSGFAAAMEKHVLGYYYHSPDTYEDIVYVDLSETHRYDYIDGLAKVQYQVRRDDPEYDIWQGRWYDANFDLRDYFGATSASHPGRVGDHAYNMQYVYQRYGSDISALRGISFLIDVPAGKHLGFYLRGDEQNHPEQYHRLVDMGIRPYTSQPGQFKGCCFSAEVLNTDGTHRSFIKDYGDMMFMGMEDAVEGGDHDCNDVIFGVTEELEIHKPSIILPDVDTQIRYTDTQLWTLAYDDVQRGADFDFNDAVITLQPDYDKQQCIVKALACGTQYEMWLHYDGPEGDVCLGEMHQLLGMPVAEMVNTQSTVPSTVFKQVATVSWPRHYSPATDARRFYIEVKRGECTDCSHIITLPERPGELPEALLVAGLWRWPLEGRHIAEAYTAFPSWAKDATRTNYWVWYSLPQKGLCVSF